MRRTFIRSPLVTGKGRHCPCSHSPHKNAHAPSLIIFGNTHLPSSVQMAPSLRDTAKLRTTGYAFYCSTQSLQLQYSHIHQHPTQHYSADVFASSQGLIAGIKRSLSSAIAIDDEIDNHNEILEHLNDALPRHCQTCTCNITIGNELLDGRHSDHSSTPTPTATCYLSEPLVPPNTPLPPPVPKPEYSFKSRILPPNLLAFDSPEGKSRFLHSLQTNNAEAYFPLSQQFLNQMDPAYCGVSTLILILNALAIDPNVRWRGGWRWYGNESMLLERCCIEEERVRREGITLEQFCGLARCQGVQLVMKRPKGETVHDGVMIDRGDTVEEFRNDVINAVNSPPTTDRGNATTTTTRHSISDDDKLKATKVGANYFLVASFARSALHQTGDGHFSPIAAYHPPSDSCLVLDVARFKYAPYWVKVQDLFDAMIPADKLTGKSRGWILMNATKHKDGTHHPTRKEELEGKRPAACVPLAGTGEYICPVEKIKIEYCSVK